MYSSLASIRRLLCDSLRQPPALNVHRVPAFASQVGQGTLSEGSFLAMAYYAKISEEKKEDNEFFFSCTTVDTAFFSPFAGFWQRQSALFRRSYPFFVRNAPCFSFNHSEIGT
jgi:hypothetical protein